MRGVLYVPIDAAKHRSSRSRVPGFVPGIRLCGHGRFLFSAARPPRSTQLIFAEITTPANKNNSCFGGPAL
jgi:hypothetical protein